MTSIFEEDCADGMTVDQNKAFVDYYRCPEEFAHSKADGDSSAEEFFSFKRSKNGNRGISPEVLSTLEAKNSA